MKEYNLKETKDIREFLNENKKNKIAIKNNMYWLIITLDSSYPNDEKYICGANFGGDLSVYAIISINKYPTSLTGIQNDIAKAMEKNKDIFMLDRENNKVVEFKY